MSWPDRKAAVICKMVTRGKNRAKGPPKTAARIGFDPGHMNSDQHHDPMRLAQKRSKGSCLSQGWETAGMTATETLNLERPAPVPPAGSGAP